MRSLIKYPYCLLSVFLLLFPAFAFSQESKVIALKDVKPDLIGGMSVHRDLLSNTKDGAVTMDVGHNIHLAGGKSTTPYAYLHDEICYVVSGEGYMVNDGKKNDVVPGEVVYRPAGAYTQAVEITQDTVTVCGFGPGFKTGQTYLSYIAPQDKNTLSEDEKPQVKVIRENQLTAQSLKTSKGVEFKKKQLVSNRKDNARSINLDITFYPQLTHLDARSDNFDSFCWLTKGEMRYSESDKQYTLTPGVFLYRPAGVVFTSTTFNSGSNMLCFYNPIKEE